MLCVNFSNARGLEQNHHRRIIYFSERLSKIFAYNVMELVPDYWKSKAHIRRRLQLYKIFSYNMLYHSWQESYFSRASFYLFRMEAVGNLLAPAIPSWEPEKSHLIKNAFTTRGSKTMNNRFNIYPLTLRNISLSYKGGFVVAFVIL